jgi:hypothetical protein
MSDLNTILEGQNNIPLQSPTAQNQDIPERFKIQDQDAWRDVRQLHPCDFMKYTYEGSEGYKDGSFLIPFVREQFYEDRRAFSYYIPIFKAIIDAMIDPVFNKLSTIDGKIEDKKINGFIENCDDCETSVKDFIWNATINELLYGVNFIVVDNIKTTTNPATNMPYTEEEVLAGRLYPYCYEKSPSQVYDYKVDDKGKLLSITFFDREEEVKEDKKTISRKYYRYWDSQIWKVFHIDDGKDDNEIEDEQGTHGLGVIPVIKMMNFVRSKSLAEFPQPPLYHLAFLCFALFNKETFVQVLELFQSFSVFYTSGLDVSSVVLGAATFLNCGTDAKFPPGYASPDSSHCAQMVSNCERLVDLIYKVADQAGVVGIKEESSGLAKKWDFRAQESILCNVADAAKNTAKQMVKMFCRYTKQDAIADKFEPDFPHDFDPGRDAERITNGLAIVREMPPESVALAAWEEIIKAFLKGDDKKIKEIMDGLKVEIEEKKAREAAEKEAALMGALEDENMDDEIENNDETPK